MTSEGLDFAPCPRDDSFEVGHELFVNRVVGDFERFQSPLARRVQDRKQGLPLIGCDDWECLPRYAASETARTRMNACLSRPSIVRSA